MLNTIFTTLYEIQIGDSVLMMVFKALNSFMLLYMAERTVNYFIKKWSKPAETEEKEEETTMRPIGFR